MNMNDLLILWGLENKPCVTGSIVMSVQEARRFWSPGEVAKRKAEKKSFVVVFK